MFFANAISGRLADELRTEQEHGIAADRATKAMAAQCMELQNRQKIIGLWKLKKDKKNIG